jgi:hypothetical protein
MLGKIMKYEWKSITKIYLLLCLFLVVSSLLGSIVTNIPAFTRAFSRNGGTAVNVLMSLTLFGVILLQAVVFFGVLFASTVYIAVRFYQTMYSKQGYLTHTLPVNYHQLMLGKLLVNSAWYVILILLAVAAEIFYILCLFNGIFSAQAGDGYGNVLGSYSNIFALIFDNLPLAAAQMREIFGIHVGGTVVLLLLSILISTPCSLMMIYGAITIGQLSSKHKIIMSILSYFALSIITGIFSNIISGIGMVRASRLVSETQFGGYLLSMLIPTLLLSLVLGAATYFISQLIIQRKLNLE